MNNSSGKEGVAYSSVFLFFEMGTSTLTLGVLL